jgi:hypothetical protein
MKTKTSLLAATFAAALASVASAQITPDPTGINTFTSPVYFSNVAQYNADLGLGAGSQNLYFDSNATLNSAYINDNTFFTTGLPAVTSGGANTHFRAGGGTVKTIFLGESAGSLTDFGYIKSPILSPIESNTFVPLATDIDNNNGFIASGWETYASYGAGQVLDFWINNPGTYNPGGAYFSFAFGTTSAYAQGDATSHTRYTWKNVMTTFQNDLGVVVTENVLTLVVAFEDLRPGNGQSGEAPTPVDGDYSDFIVAFQFLPTQVAVPEPSTYGLIGAGALLGLVGYRRFKASKKAA